MLRIMLLAFMALTCTGNTEVIAEHRKDPLLQEAFSSAAREFGVPESILLAVSYSLSRWEHHNGQSSTSAGFGLMHLTEKRTLQEAAALLHVDPERLKQDPVQNIRGAAALLAHYTKESLGSKPAEEKDWYGAVAHYMNPSETVAALVFADEVYDLIHQGAERQLSNGQTVRLKAKDVKPNKATAKNSEQTKGKSSGEAECPKGLDCRFIPAASSNFDVADRPHFGPEIKYILLHNTEESYTSSMNWFMHPKSGVAAQYLLRSSDGQITQMVNNRDVPWHAGNWYFNMHSIGLEHEGYAMEGATWYTEHLYRSSAKLVRYLADRYHIPVDRDHIFGHDEIPGLTPVRQSAMHEDPGPFWDWEHYMELLGAPIISVHESSNMVTIRPHFTTNKPFIRNAPSQPSNFVYLHKAPRHDSPLIRDPAAGGRNPYEALAIGAKASAGQTFYQIERRGEWMAIWFGGEKAWFHNPKGNKTVSGNGILIKPAPGKGSIPVYGGAFPESAAYPAVVSVRELPPLQYRIKEGQIYVAAEKVKSDIYHATKFTMHPYLSHRLIVGKDEFYRIHFNHRFAFVKASDVVVLK